MRFSPVLVFHICAGTLGVACSSRDAPMRIWRRLIQAIGVVSFGLSLWGFYWLLGGFRRELVQPLHMAEAPFFGMPSQSTQLMRYSSGR